MRLDHLIHETKKHRNEQPLIINRFEGGMEFWQDLPKTKAEALNWIWTTKPIERFIIANDVDRWPDRLKSYREHTKYLTVAHLMDKFNISPTKV